MTTLPARVLFPPTQFTCFGDYKINSDRNGEIELESTNPSTAQTVNLRFSLPRSTTSNKGSRLDSLNIGYRVETNDLLGSSAVLRSIAYGPSPVTSTITTTSSGFSLTAGSDYKATLTVAAPAFENSANPLAYEVAVTFTGQTISGNIVRVKVYYIEAVYTNDFTA